LPSPSSLMPLKKTNTEASRLLGQLVSSEEKGVGVREGGLRLGGVEVGAHVLDSDVGVSGDNAVLEALWFRVAR